MLPSFYAAPQARQHGKPSVFDTCEPNCLRCMAVVIGCKALGKHGENMLVCVILQAMATLQRNTAKRCALHWKAWVDKKADWRSFQARATQRMTRVRYQPIPP